VQQQERSLEFDSPGREVSTFRKRWNLIASELLNLPSCKYCGSPSIFIAEYTIPEYSQSSPGYRNRRDIKIRALSCNFCQAYNVVSREEGSWYDVVGLTVTTTGTGELTYQEPVTDSTGKFFITWDRNTVDWYQ